EDVADPAGRVGAQDRLEGAVQAAGLDAVPGVADDADAIGVGDGLIFGGRQRGGVAAAAGHLVVVEVGAVGHRRHGLDVERGLAAAIGVGGAAVDGHDVQVAV